MKIIASCLLALGAVSQEASAFVSPSLGQRANVAQLRAESLDTDAGALATMDPTDFELLGLPARPGRPLKVAIAGGGVGGLTAAYYMLKKVRRCKYHKQFPRLLDTGMIESRSSSDSVLLKNHNPLNICLFLVSNL